MSPKTKKILLIIAILIVVAIIIWYILKKTGAIAPGSMFDFTGTGWSRAQKQAPFSEWSDYKKQYYRDQAIKGYAGWAAANPWPSLLASVGEGKDINQVALENATWFFDEGTLSIDAVKADWWPEVWAAEARRMNLNDKGF